MITLDTSGILALLDAADPDHSRAADALRAERPPFVVPAAILAEAGYMIERTLGSDAIDAFLGDLAEGTFTLDCGDEDLDRIRSLTRRYADLPLGVADAGVVACAARRGGRMLTLDRRDFEIVARDVPLTILP